MGSEMCIRDRALAIGVAMIGTGCLSWLGLIDTCLLYTSDAADEGLGVDLGGRRIIKKKKKKFFFFFFFIFFFFFKQKTAYEMLRSLVGSEMCIRDSLMPG